MLTSLQASFAVSKNQAKCVQVDRETCIGCMLCAIDYPQVFEMDSEGKAVAKNPDGDTEENLQKSIDLCPVKAISFIPEQSDGNP